MKLTTARDSVFDRLCCRIDRGDYQQLWPTDRDRRRRLRELYCRKSSGDLEGMRVVIVPAGGGYYAIVQIAQGGAEDPKPEFVPADVKGKSVLSVSAMTNTPAPSPRLD